MARYRTWDLPMNNEILSCAGNRDTSENARGNKSVATAAKGLLFRFCRGNAERTTTLTTLEGWFVPAGYISYFAIFAMVPDGLAVLPDADDDEKDGDDDDDDDAVRSAVRQHLRPDRVDESFNIWTCSGALLYFIPPRRASLRHSLLMPTWCSLFCCVSSSQPLPVLRNKIRSTTQDFPHVGVTSVGEKASKGEIILLSITLNTLLAHKMCYRFIQIYSKSAE
ncbi:hypothetical protein ALC56_11923 [Trachymyrmex septentrionalis]|uniref:Uncharacterized protein n=1 Tax=Trachymyrmex septentrionalis TaxID=34720 RepID=A0A195EZX6_9HYME|nr:hypothetical protein ALC56_11923 [Trachymyrmex septentrionalis]